MKVKRVWIFIVICPITYSCLLNGDLTMAWRVVSFFVLLGGEGSEGADLIPSHIWRGLYAEKIV